MLKIAICDDILIDSEQISKYILSYQDKFMLDIEIEVFSSGEEFLSTFQKYGFKIIFLDIYMGGLSGVETAIKIRELDKNCIIIFTTSSPDFRAEGFAVNATHYLLKPLTYEKLEEALDRCKRQFTGSERYFNINIGRRIVPIHFMDVLYIDVYDKLVLIHTASETLKTYTSLEKVAEMLEGGPFLKCHRCYIVNMSYISSVLEESFKIDNGEEIPIRRKGRQEIKDEYSKYFINSVRERKDG